jgi:hypothetical protein
LRFALKLDADLLGAQLAGDGFGLQLLDGDITLERRIARKIDRAHPSCPQQADDTITIIESLAGS